MWCWKWPALKGVCSFYCWNATFGKASVLLGWLAVPFGSHHIRLGTPAGKHEIALARTADAVSAVQVKELLLLQSGCCDCTGLGACEAARRADAMRGRDSWISFLSCRKQLLFLYTLLHHKLLLSACLTCIHCKGRLSTLVTHRTYMLNGRYPKAARSNACRDLVPRQAASWQLQPRTICFFLTHGTSMLLC